MRPVVRPLQGATSFLSLCPRVAIEDELPLGWYVIPILGIRDC